MNDVVQKRDVWDLKNPYYESPEDRINRVTESLEGIHARIEKGNQLINLARDLLIDYVCQEGIVKTDDNAEYPQEVDIIIRLINLTVSDNNLSCDLLADNKKELSFIADRVQVMKEPEGLTNERP